MRSKTEGAFSMHQRSAVEDGLRDAGAYVAKAVAS